MKIDTTRYDSLVAAIPSDNSVHRPEAFALNDGVSLALTAAHPATSLPVEIHVSWTGSRRKPKERSLYLEAGDAVHTVSQDEMSAWVAAGRPLPADLAALSADIQPLLDAFMEAETLYLKALATAARAEAYKSIPTKKAVWPWSRPAKPKPGAGIPAPSASASRELAAVVAALQ